MLLDWETSVNLRSGRSLPLGSFLFLRNTIRVALFLVAGATATALAQFETRSSVSVSTEPFSFAVGDFNRDGKLDLAVTSYVPTNGITILLGNGDGTFRLGESYAAGVQLFYVTAASFRHNGILDLVVGDSLSNDVYVLLGNGDGTFQQAVPYPTSGNPFAVRTGDFTGDGQLDIIALAEPGAECNCIEVLPGNGDGTFKTVVITPVPYNVQGLALAVDDFNGDNKLDVAVTGEFGTAKQVNILLGNGDGTFRPDGHYDVSLSPESIVAADFNGDKKIDLAVGNRIGGSVSVLLGNGDGTFQPRVDYPTVFPSWILAYDFDGDGHLDLAASNAGQVGIPAGVTVLRGNGDGTFQTGVFYPAGREQVNFVAAGDFNGDQRADLAVADYIDDTVITLLNTGVVSFSPTTPVRFPTQLVGTSSSAQTVTLTNTGTTALVISSASLKGPFNLNSTCRTTVAPGGSCAMNVTFSPQSQGSKSGTISIMDSASHKPQVVVLTGAGTVVDLTPESLVFGLQKVGTKSAVQQVQLTNTGATILNISKIEISGTQSQDFSQANNCGSSLRAGTSCIIQVTFTPHKTGLRIAQINVTDSGGGSPQKISLRGTGD